jgi:hypothetical protein
MRRLWGASTLPVRLIACFAVMIALVVQSGCGGRNAVAPQSDAQERLSKLMNLYRAYVEKNQKGPPSEQALREFGQKLTAAERSDRVIGEDLDGIFTSPRDNQKFVVQYNVKPEPSTNRALAWESTGKNGMHFVALTMGYVVEYDEQTLKQYTK